MGASKSGLVTKVRTPVEELMVKSAESLPLVIEKLNEAPASTSVAAYVTTDVMFSAWLKA